MKFDDEVRNTKYYTNWESLPSERKKIIESKDNRIESLKSDMFDLCDVEKIFLSEEFLLKEAISPNITIFIEMNDSSFIEFLDVRNELLNDDITVLCEVGSVCYRITIDTITECKAPSVKVLIPNERLY